MCVLYHTGEYIDDTEDLVNINLDYSRNNLIRFELLITMGTFALAFYSYVAELLRGSTHTHTHTHTLRQGHKQSEPKGGVRLCSQLVDLGASGYVIAQNV